jgi:hypothetical protein
VLDVPVAITAELYRNGLRVWQKDLNIRLGDGREYTDRSIKFYWSSAYIPSTALIPNTPYLFTIFFRNNTGIYATGGLDFQTPAAGPPTEPPPPPGTPPIESDDPVSLLSSWKTYALIGIIGLLAFVGIKRFR